LVFARFTVIVFHTLEMEAAPARDGGADERVWEDACIAEGAYEEDVLHLDNWKGRQIGWDGMYVDVYRSGHI
jgi:hypothetical protein